MTGYTVHTGSTEAFSSGFDRIFGAAAGPGAKAAAGTAKGPKAAAPKKAVKKTAPAKGAKKKTKAEKKTNKDEDQD